jgi:molybdopterin/thiamine biosynthesis adenylyltransferase
LAFTTNIGTGQSTNMEITDEQLARYARHIILDEVGEEGQLRLLQSKVLVVGAGGLGSPLLMYLAAAGVGTLGIVDHDVVDITNLQRQIVHKTEDVGQSKVTSAKEAVFDINPDVNVVTHQTRLTPKNVANIVSQYDLVADGSDNFPTRYLINDACFFAARPLVSAAVLRFEGQISTFIPYKGGHNPCYRCLFPAPPPPDLVPRCEQVGIFGSMAGVMGSIQTTEVLKHVLGLGDNLSGKLLIYDALNTTFRKILVKPSSSCALCGEHPTITATTLAEEV